MDVIDRQDQEAASPCSDPDSIVSMKVAADA
jgi:hypothetical protein